MGRRRTSDAVSGFTLGALVIVANIVVFFTVWWPAALVSAFILFAIGVESLLLAAIVATVFAGFVVWFLNKATDVITSGVVAIFGNEPARNAVVAQYQGTRDPAEVIVEDARSPLRTASRSGCGGSPA